MEDFPALPNLLLKRAAKLKFCTPVIGLKGSEKTRYNMRNSLKLVSNCSLHFARIFVYVSTTVMCFRVAQLTTSEGLYPPGGLI